MAEAPAAAMAEAPVEQSGVPGDGAEEPPKKKAQASAPEQCLHELSADTEGSASACLSPAGVQAIIGNRPMKLDLPYTTLEGLAVAQGFRANQGDVFISTYPKTGTTWMQQICHQLRTGGHTDFEEISYEGVVPWLEVNPSLDFDVTLPQVAEPRVFKSHQRLSALSHLEADGGKFICVVRDPEASLKSYFKFLLAKKRPETDSKDVNAFIRTEAMVGSNGGSFGGSIWEFYAEYWRCRKLPSVKVVVYEHLRKNTTEELRKINTFLGLAELDDERLSKVLELSSMQWMSANDHLFDDHYIAERFAQKTGQGGGEVAPARISVKKVGLEVQQEGVITELSLESKEFLSQVWKQVMEPITGCSSYAEMIAQL